MKIAPPLSPPARTGNNLRLGIVRLGRAAGKTKYALVDEADISLVQQYAFEARLEVDPNGLGAVVYAWAYDIKRGRLSGEYVHTLLWELHRGGIAPGWKVIHLNNITVDNRLDNLALVPVGATSTIGQAVCSSGKAGVPSIPTPQEKENCLYWVAIAQLPIDPIEEYSLEVRERLHNSNMSHSGSSSGYRTCLNRNGELLEGMGGPDDECGGVSLGYYECRYPPCTQMEQHLRQFSICGRCQEARYCGTFCQQRDWPVHKKTCQPKPKTPSVVSDRSPER